jgi:TRAP-type C4-dicarboxylate transport system permease small subunit
MHDTNSKPPLVSRVMLWIACAALIVMMLIVVVDVVQRALFNMPLRGSIDMTSIALLVMVAFGTAPVLVRREEIIIDLIDPVIGQIGVRILGTLAAIGTGGMVLFIGWSSLDPLRDALRWGETSLELGLPQWILWVVAMIGLTGIMWGAVVQILHYLRKQPEGNE